MAAPEQKKDPPAKSFLWLKKSKSSLLTGAEARSSWTSTDSGNSESILPMSTPTQENLSSTPSSPPNNSRQPHAFSAVPPSAFTKPPPTERTYQYPPPTNSSLTPSQNPHHTRTLTASTSNSSQQTHSPRAHPYQLAAYDSYNYRSIREPDRNSTPPRDTLDGVPHPFSQPSAAASQEKIGVHEQQKFSPRAPLPPLPTSALLSESAHGSRTSGLAASENRDRLPPRRGHQRRQSLGTLASLRILNTYATPSSPDGAAQRLGGALGSQNALLSGVIISTLIVLPTVLSVIYVSAGHAVLRSARSQDRFSIYYLAGIESSAQAAAVGGAILAVPILLVLYLIGLFPPGTMSSGTDNGASRPGDRQQAGQDFFEDSDSGSTKDGCSPSQLLHYATLSLCVLLVLSVGGIAGPLGVTVLSSTDAAATSFGEKVFLSPGAAAAAGFVGGCIIFGGLAMILSASLGIILLQARIESGPPLER